MDGNGNNIQNTEIKQIIAALAAIEKEQKKINPSAIVKLFFRRNRRTSLNGRIIDDLEDKYAPLKIEYPMLVLRSTQNVGFPVGIQKLLKNSVKGLAILESKLVQKTFRLFDSFNLEYICIDRLEMTPDYFKSSVLKSLTCLHLKNISIEEIPARWHSPALTELCINSTQIKSIPGSVLTDKLKTLTVTDSAFSKNLEINPPLNKNLKNLENLTLKFLDVSEIPQKLISPKLEKIEISKVLLQKLPDLSELTKINSLTIRDVQLPDKKDGAEQTIAEEEFNRFNSWSNLKGQLKTLDLSGSNIRKLPDWLFENGKSSTEPKLNILNIERCRLETIPPYFLANNFDFTNELYEEQKSETKKNVPKSKIKETVYINKLYLKDMDVRLFHESEKAVRSSLLEAYYNSGEMEPMHETKVVFIGSDTERKQKILNRVARITDESVYRKTDGIKIFEEPLINDDGKSLLSSGLFAQFWDFDSAPSFREGRWLFLNDFNTYVVVLEAERTNTLYQAAMSWGTVLKSYAPNSEVIFVVDEVESDCRPLSSNHLSKIAKLSIDAWIIRLPKNNEASAGYYEILRKRIGDVIKNTTLYNCRLPIQWKRAFRLLEQTLTLSEMISYERFTEIINRFDINNEDVALGILHFLERSGKIFVLYDDEEKKKPVRLFHPIFLAQFVKKSLELAESLHGTVTVKELVAAMDDNIHFYYNNQICEHILKFMQKKRICYGWYDKKGKYGYRFPSKRDIRSLREISEEEKFAKLDAPQYVTANHSRQPDKTHPLYEWIIDNQGRKIWDESLPKMHYKIECHYLPQELLTAMICRLVEELYKKDNSNNKSVEESTTRCRINKEGMGIYIKENSKMKTIAYISGIPGINTELHILIHVADSPEDKYKHKEEQKKIARKHAEKILDAYKTAAKDMFIETFEDKELVAYNVGSLEIFYSLKGIKSATTARLSKVFDMHFGYEVSVANLQKLLPGPDAK